MSNSALVSYTQISPNCNVPRRQQIRKITPHHMAGWLTLPEFGALVAKSSRQMSANYAIDKDGNIGLFCNEANRSWCSSSPENDHQAVTIEVANDGGAPDWHVSEAAWRALVDLCVDICRRNPGLAGGLLYTGNARGTLTKHSYFSATACPGPYLGGRFAELAREVNRRLSGAQAEPMPAGTALHLERVPLYVASNSLSSAGTRTGTYYLWGTTVIGGRVRITNSPDNAGRPGQVTGWIDLADAMAAAGVRDQGDDDRGLSTIRIAHASNVQALALYELAQALDLAAPGYYRSAYTDTYKTAQQIEIGQISAGDAQAVRKLCEDIGAAYAG